MEGDPISFGSDSSEVRLINPCEQKPNSRYPLFILTNPTWNSQDEVQTVQVALVASGFTPSIAESATKPAENYAPLFAPESRILLRPLTIEVRDLINVSKRSFLTEDNLQKLLEDISMFYHMDLRLWRMIDTHLTGRRRLEAIRGLGAIR
jgi:hypothetical protein